jgi:hypothetical protein
MHMMSSKLDRRGFAGLLLGGLAASAWSGSRAAAGAIEVQVFKNPQCGCCNGWVSHLEADGFSVSVQDLDDLTQIKRVAGVPDELSACHTAVLDRYSIEGHVPAAALQRLLAARPDIRGLAVPGMPAGSPGMPSPRPERYDVLAFTADGRISRFMTFLADRPV